MHQQTSATTHCDVPPACQPPVQLHPLLRRTTAATTPAPPAEHAASGAWEPCLASQRLLAVFNDKTCCLGARSARSPAQQLSLACFVLGRASCCWQQAGESHKLRLLLWQEGGEVYKWRKMNVLPILLPVLLTHTKVVAVSVSCTAAQKEERTIHAGLFVQSKFAH